jgi:hypothetical protein
MKTVHALVATCAAVTVATPAALAARNADLPSVNHALGGTGRPVATHVQGSRYVSGAPGRNGGRSVATPRMPCLCGRSSGISHPLMV